MFQRRCDQLWLQKLQQTRQRKIEMCIEKPSGNGPTDEAIWTMKPVYNDIELVVDEKALNRLLEAGVDELLAQHVAHLWIRDPLVIYSDLIEVDDEKSTHHWETIQSTNWQNVRFKPPPDDSYGWRVEFRTMEIQLTDFENAAFATFVTLVSRAILHFGLNFYIPMSKVDENFETAHQQSAVIHHKFWWRNCNAQDGSTNAFELYTMEEIMNGKGNCMGLIPLVQKYCEFTQVGPNTKQLVEKYLEFIRKRSRGELYTTAQWWRRFVSEHPLYNHDSVISPQLAKEIVRKAAQLGKGEIIEPLLTGDITYGADFDAETPFETPEFKPTLQGSLADDLDLYDT